MKDKKNKLPEIVETPSRFRNTIGKYIVKRSSKCKACGKCAQLCPYGVHIKPDKYSKPLRPVEHKCIGFKCSGTDHFCIDNCPMQAIDFSVTPPVFNRNCDKCYLCEMACPNGAIEYDYEPLQATHNNENAVPQLMKSLEIFEARGKFRRLVPMEEIGWDTPFYRFPKPRYKVVR